MRPFALALAALAAVVATAAAQTAPLSTPEARVASCLDRLAPMLLNWLSAGRTWRELDVDAGQVRAVNIPSVSAVSPTLARVVEALIDDAVARGWLRAE